jgi:glycerophosphoryl diester phosphodiesterase
MERGFMKVMLMMRRFVLGVLAFGLMPAALLAAAPVELIAHRGESADAPENTLAAFRLAWDRNVPAIELDVHLTKDGQLICSHDADTKRTTGVQRKIVDSTASELQELDAGAWKDERFRGEKMPLLTEALATLPEKGCCFIEVKVGAEAIPALVKAVNASKCRPEQLVVISFQADAVAEAKRQLPELKAYFLESFKQNKKTGQWTPTIDEVIETAKKIHADGVDLSYKGPLDAAVVQRIKDAGLKCYVWTIDDPAIARTMIAAGVDGITTNKAAGLGEALQASP